jgi:iron complex transport system ATP-binding protein
VAELAGRHLAFATGAARLLDDVSVAVRAGELVAILGPNGAGKTTLLRVLLGMLPAGGGETLLDGAPLAQLSASQRARRVAYLPQNRPLAWPNTVRDIVALGRFAHGAALGRLGVEDSAAVRRALADCDLEGLAGRRADTLSGGELARVHIARALAGGTPLLVADEPVAALDPLHQHRIAALLRHYVAGGGGAMVVLHELSLAARIADRIVFMQGGRVVAEGPVADVMTAATIREVYGVRARVVHDAQGIDVRIDGPAPAGAG